MNLYESIKNNLKENDIMIKKNSYTEKVFSTVILHLQEKLSEDYVLSLTNRAQEMEVSKAGKHFDTLTISFEDNNIVLNSLLGPTKIIGAYRTEINDALYDYSEIDRGTILSIYSFYLNVIEQYEGGNLV